MNKNEELFWSIFRNRFLNKIIFEKIKCKCRLLCFSYDEIVFSEWMIIHNYLELLKYKVKRGDGLIFNNTWVNVLYKHSQPLSIKSSNSRFKYDKLEDDYSLIISRKGIYDVNSIFNWFKDDYDFYFNLFKNYSNYFKVNNNFNNNYEIKELKENEKIKRKPMCQSEGRIAVHPLSLKEIINLIIVFDNVSAMKVLVDQSYYIRDDEQIFKDFIKSFEIGSLKLAEFIYNNYLNLEYSNEKEKTQSLWDLAVFTETNFMDIKNDGLQLFLDKYYLMKKLKNNNNKNNNNNKKYNYNNHENNNNNIIISNNGEIIMKNIKSILTYNIFKVEFKILIGYAEIISLLNDQFDFQNNIINNFKPNTNYIDINESLEQELKEISILSLNEIYELKCKLIEKKIINEIKPLNQLDWDSLKKDLERLYKMLILFTGLSISENYFLFKLKYYNKTFNFKSMNFIINNSNFKNNNNNNNYNNFNNNNDYFLYKLKDGKILVYSQVFSNYYHNKKIQLKSFLEDCQLDLNLKENKNQSTSLFELIIKDYQDDQEMIEYCIDNFLFKEISSIPNVHQLFENVKSIRAFDLIYESLQLKYPEKYSTIYYNKLLSTIVENFELATHFKEKYPTQYKMALKSTKFNDLFLGNTFDQIKFIIHNWLDFKDIIIIRNKHWILDLVKHEKKFNLCEFKTFISSFDNAINDDSNGGGDEFDKSLYYANDLEESFYVYHNKKEHLESGVCKPISIEFMHTINYLNGEFDFSLLKFENEKSYENLFKHIIERCDFKAIDQIVSILGQPDESEYDPDYTNLDIILYILSQEAYERGNTIVFDYLQDKSKKGFIETSDRYPW
ncbi:hypothetical protein ACTFIU_002518 [Dictyostelium citrinum]